MPDAEQPTALVAICEISLGHATPHVLLTHYFKQLKLPNDLKRYADRPGLRPKRTLGETFLGETFETKKIKCEPPHIFWSGGGLMSTAHTKKV